MSEDNRHLEPTLRRRQQARREGQVASSRQVTAAAAALAFATMFSIAAPRALASIKLLFNRTWMVPWSSHHPGPQSGLPVWGEPLWLAAQLVLPLLGLMMGTAILARLLQTGIIWAPHRVLPKAARVDPSMRLAERFHLGRLAEACLLGILLLLGVGLTVLGLWQQRHEILAVANAAAFEIELTNWLTRWFLFIALGVSLLAALDYGCQRYRFEQQLRMSAEEMRAEVRAIQGNPEIARARQERGRRRYSEDAQDASLR